MISEKIFEDILSKYPELIEDPLKFVGRQVTLFGRRMDLLFEDKFKRRLIIELKAGPIKDEHIGQILSYEGMLLSADDPTIRVMLIGTRVPPNLKKTLDHHGISWKEITNNQLASFLAEKQDDSFKEYFENQDIEKKAINKPYVKIGKENRSSKSQSGINAATNIDELSNIIRMRSITFPTNYMDLLLLENETHMLSEILTLYQNYKAKNNDFKSVSRIKQHIRFREKHDGWIFKTSGDPNNPVVKLIGLK